MEELRRTPVWCTGERGGRVRAHAVHWRSSHATHATTRAHPNAQSRATVFSCGCSSRQCVCACLSSKTPARSTPARRARLRPFSSQNVNSCGSSTCGIQRLLLGGEPTRGSTCGPPGACPEDSPRGTRESSVRSRVCVGSNEKTSRRREIFCQVSGFAPGSVCCLSRLHPPDHAR